MKKVLPFIIIPYVVLMVVIGYLFLGPGVFHSFVPLKWQELDMKVPSNWEIKEYESKGWRVYSLQKMGTLIKIATKEAFAVTTMPRHYQTIMYQHSPAPDRILFVAKMGRGAEWVFAYSVEDTTLYFSVTAPSPFASKQIMKKLLAHCFFRGKAVVLPAIKAPLKVYLTDLLILGGLLLPELLIFVIFYFSGHRPSYERFVGDPIQCEESYVFFTALRKYRSRSSLCYFVLTANRLMIFQFKRPTWECRLAETTPDIYIERKKIIIQTEKDRFILRPASIEMWQECLRGILHKAGKVYEKRY